MEFSFPLFIYYVRIYYMYIRKKRNETFLKLHIFHNPCERDDNRYTFYAV